MNSNRKAGKIRDICYRASTGRREGGKILPHTSGLECNASNYGLQLFEAMGTVMPAVLLIIGIMYVPGL